MRVTPARWLPAAARSGSANHVENDYDFIGAGLGNQVGAASAGGASAVVAGTGNIASGGSAFIGAWGDNKATANYATVVSGQFNTASGLHSAVVAGLSNTASGSRSTVAGGGGNTAGGIDSAVAGGHGNKASGDLSTVAGGSSNTAGALDSTVAGGYTNTASSLDSTVAGGYANTASGLDSTVSGYTNTASGEFSFAAGSFAVADELDAFVWSDGNFDDGSREPRRSTRRQATQFTAHATGGFNLWTNSSGGLTGCGIVAGGGTMVCSSSRKVKDDFAPVDRAQVLKRLARIPITTWHYKSEKAGARHIGPMAQDFARAFHFGQGNTGIAMVDADGISLAAIQGLYRQNEALNGKLAGLERQNRALSARLTRLEHPESER